MHDGDAVAMVTRMLKAWRLKSEEDSRCAVGVAGFSGSVTALPYPPYSCGLSGARTLNAFSSLFSVFILNNDI